MHVSASAKSTAKSRRLSVEPANSALQQGQWTADLSRPGEATVTRAACHSLHRKVSRSLATPTRIIDRHSERDVLAVNYRRDDKNENGTSQPITSDKQDDTAHNASNCGEKSAAPGNPHRQHPERAAARGIDIRWSAACRTNAFRSFVSFTTACANRHKSPPLTRHNVSYSENTPTLRHRLLRCEGKSRCAGVSEGLIV